jgi:hypothetical protein
MHGTFERHLYLLEDYVALKKCSLGCPTVCLARLFEKP